MSESPWWATLYARQHAIWPAWSEGEADAPATAAFLSRHLGSVGHALDLGCGVGRELCALARCGWHGTGLDLSPGLVRRAQERARRLRVADRVTFETADLLAGVPPDGPFDLVLLWDSTLAIWPPEVQERLVRRWIAPLAPSGALVVGQLARAWFAARDTEHFVISGAHVGPGRTERTYRWEVAQQVLLDEVVYVPPEGPSETLPTQRLHLQSAEDLRGMLEGAGLSTTVFGSTGWPLRDHPPDATSRRVIAIGRVR